MLTVTHTRAGSRPGAGGTRVTASSHAPLPRVTEGGAPARLHTRDYIIRQTYLIKSVFSQKLTGQSNLRGKGKLFQVHGFKRVFSSPEPTSPRAEPCEAAASPSHAGRPSPTSGKSTISRPGSRGRAGTGDARAVNVGAGSALRPAGLIVGAARRSWKATQNCSRI